MARRELENNLAATIELFEFGLAMQRQNLRREFPELSEAKIDERFVEWLVSRPLDAPGRRRNFQP